MAVLLAYPFFTAFFYYPKWDKQGSEATISWDVSGYYLYLPAFFIYQDARELRFMDDILEQYRPTDELQQAFQHFSGNYVFKYSCGQAIFYAPFFTIAHAWASFSKHPADGFSYPYQFMISLGSLLLAFWGLWLLRLVLLRYFTDRAVSLTLFFLVLGTNYLAYSAINGAMTHNSLFTLYALLLYLSDNFYRNTPSPGKALGIGAVIGVMALIRPTEIISALIPLLWSPGKGSLGHILLERWTFIKRYFRYYLIAAIATALVGSLQLAYWKYATGSWLVYSYQEQGFDWLSPHIFEGLFSYKAGWLVYTPILLFSLLGGIPLYRQHRQLFWPVWIHFLLFVYIAFAWSIWWYGGSLGQRSMIQAYAVLALPFTAFLQWLLEKGRWKFMVFGLMGLMTWYSLWWTHQAHQGKFFKPEQMTQQYFWRVLWRSEVPEYVLKYLDTQDVFPEKGRDIQTIYRNDFEKVFPPEKDPSQPIEGNGTLILDEKTSQSPEFFVPLTQTSANWIRAKAIFSVPEKEWNYWVMTQFVLRIWNGDQVVKENLLRVHRFLKKNQQKELSLEMKLPKTTFDRASILFRNPNGGKKAIIIDDLELEVFRE